MSVCPTNFDEKVECPFFDRKEFIEAFEKALLNIDQKDYSILVYYGVAGIGKTSLRKELLALLEEKNESDRQTRVIWTSIDFATEQYRQPYKFLEVLSTQLRQKYGIKFNSFDIALATYWKKVNPHVPLVRENYSEESIVRDVLDICNEFVPVNLIPNVLNLAKSLPERYQKWALKRKKDISRLPNFEPTEIEELLPVYWAYDLADHLHETLESAVIFIDTYEALWEKEREKGSFNDRDKWLRKLIENIQKSCLWVICGRETLRWKEVDEDWKNYLDQHKIEKLPEKDALDLLKWCGIAEEDIQKALIESSEGVPYSLELSIDTYRKIKKKKQPSPENFAKVPDGIFCRFVKYLDREEKETLKVLSVPRYWNRELFEILVEKLNTGYPATSFSELHSFSFMDIDDKGKCSMHQLMRKSLQEYQDQELKKEVHIFMCIYYSFKIKDLNIKTINPEHENALTEAFYHAKEILEADDLLRWVVSATHPFYKAALWKNIYPLYEELLQIIETKLGKEHPYVATTMNNLAGLHILMGEYEKGLLLHQKALKIYENFPEKEYINVGITLSSIAGCYHKIGEYKKSVLNYRKAIEILKKIMNTEFAEDYAIVLNNFAELYRDVGEYEKALPLYKKSLEIVENLLGPESTSFATISNNLALLYTEKGNYKEARVIYKQVLKIRKKIYGELHPEVANSYNTLADLYGKMGEYKKSLLFFEKALKIRERTLGEMHPSVANTLNSVAGLNFDMKNYQKAAQLYEKTLEIRKSTLGEENPNIATTLNDLGLVYHELEDHKKAFSLYYKALDIQKEKLGMDNKEIGTTLNNLAGLYLDIGEYEKALPLFLEALQIREKVFGPEHPEVAAILNNLAELYETMGEYEKALPLYKRALEIVEKKLGQNHPNTITVKNNYNGLLLEVNGENEEK